MASYILISEILKGCNVEIIHSRCGLHAINLFQKNPSFDLIITELRLPKTDGFGVLKEVRKIIPNIPVITQTASVLDNMKCNCLNAGFNEFIPKPIDISFFVSVVNMYIHDNILVGLESA